jgi:hypothetical protein
MNRELGDCTSCNRRFPITKLVIAAKVEATKDADERMMLIGVEKNFRTKV